VVKYKFKLNSNYNLVEMKYDFKTGFVVFHGYRSLKNIKIFFVSGICIIMSILHRTSCRVTHFDTSPRENAISNSSVVVYFRIPKGLIFFGALPAVLLILALEMNVRFFITNPNSNYESAQQDSRIEYVSFRE